MESCSRVSERDRFSDIRDKKLGDFFNVVIEKHHGYFMYSFIDEIGLQNQVRSFVNSNQKLFYIWGRGSKTSPLIIQLKPQVLSRFNIATKNITKASTFAKAVDSILLASVILDFKNNLIDSNYYVDSRINTPPEKLTKECVIVTTKKRLPLLRQLFPDNQFYVPKYLECFYF